MNKKRTYDFTLYECRNYKNCGTRVLPVELDDCGGYCFGCENRKYEKENND